MKGATRRQITAKVALQIYMSLTLLFSIFYIFLIAGFINEYYWIMMVESRLIIDMPVAEWYALWALIAISIITIIRFLSKNDIFDRLSMIFILAIGTIAVFYSAWTDVWYLVAKNRDLSWMVGIGDPNNIYFFRYWNGNYDEFINIGPFHVQYWIFSWIISMMITFLTSLIMWFTFQRNINKKESVRDFTIALITGFMLCIVIMITTVFPDIFLFVIMIVIFILIGIIFRDGFRSRPRESVIFTKRTFKDIRIRLALITMIPVTLGLLVGGPWVLILSVLTPILVLGYLWRTGRYNFTLVLILSIIPMFLFSGMFLPVTFTTLSATESTSNSENIISSIVAFDPTGMLSGLEILINIPNEIQKMFVDYTKNPDKFISNHHYRRYSASIFLPILDVIFLFVMIIMIIVGILLVINIAKSSVDGVVDCVTTLIKCLLLIVVLLVMTFFIKTSWAQQGILSVLTPNSIIPYSLVNPTTDINPLSGTIYGFFTLFILFFNFALFATAILFWWFPTILQPPESALYKEVNLKGDKEPGILILFFPCFVLAAVIAGKAIQTYYGPIDTTLILFIVYFIMSIVFIIVYWINHSTGISFQIDWQTAKGTLFGLMLMIVMVQSFGSVIHFNLSTVEWNFFWSDILIVVLLAGWFETIVFMLTLGVLPAEIAIMILYLYDKRNSAKELRLESEKNQKEMERLNQEGIAIMAKKNLTKIDRDTLIFNATEYIALEQLEENKKASVEFDNTRMSYINYSVVLGICLIFASFLFGYMHYWSSGQDWIAFVSGGAAYYVMGALVWAATLVLFRRYYAIAFQHILFNLIVVLMFYGGI